MNQQPSLGRRVIAESGPITNVLVALGLVDQTKIAMICKRTYDVTVPQVRVAISLPKDLYCNFPNLRIPSDDFACRRMKATVEGV
jgi:hypothetical protein